MNVRPLTAMDAADYRALRLRALWEYPEAFTSSYDEEEDKPIGWYEQRLSAAGVHFFGAFADGQLCGVVGLEREKRAKNRHKATVVGMYVSTEYNGRGIGRGLMDVVLGQARQDALALLVLTVTEGNDKARELYDSVGFRSFGLEPQAIQIDGKFFAKNHMYLEL